MFTSLPFGDAFSTTSGTDADANHYTSLDHDASSSTEHAIFRQYSSTQGRWLSPDPYNGSYDLSNAQSFNRYAYVLNNPLGYADPLGLTPYTLTDSTTLFTNWAQIICFIGYCGNYTGGGGGVGGGGGSEGGAPAPSKTTCTTGFGFGFQGGADTAMGVMKGTAATGGGGAGAFFGSNGASLGVYASGGAMSNFSNVRGYPSQSMGTPAALGGGTGGGAGVFFTNASSASQLRGPFFTFGGSAAFGLVGLGVQLSIGTDGSGNNIWHLGVSYAGGAGLYGYAMTTNTKAATTGVQCK